MRVVLGVFVLLGVLFVVAVLDLQTMQSDRLESWGQDQRTRSRALPGYRGNVTDRDGFVLAASTPTLQLVADPQLVVDAAATAELLGEPLGVAQDELVEALTPATPEDRYGLLAPSLDDRAVAVVADLLDSEQYSSELAGISLRPVEDRVYPAGVLGRPVVGMVDPDERGIYGIEWQLDEYLQGHAGVERYERGVFGRITGGDWNVEPASPGADVALTIDHRIQYVVEEALESHCTEMGARSAHSVVSDPRTGEILAMATVRREDSGNCEVAIYNAPMVDTFEPGSVLKLVTVAAAVNELGYDSSTMIPVPPAIEVGDKVFRDHPTHPPADFPVAQILGDSMNVGTIRLAQELGSERLYAYLKQFGFGEESGIGFKDEATGTVPDVWHGSEHGSIPIGQGVTVNSLQLITAYNAIANDGVLVSPKLIRSIAGEDGRSYDIPAQESRAVVAPETASEVTSMLTRVVASGTGTAAAIDGYTVAGKTGTAWKVFADGPYAGTYGVDGARNYVVTFAGFLPAEDPQLSIIVVVDEPTVETTAGKVAAPVFADIAHYVVRILGIPPTTRGVEEEGRVRGVPAGTETDPETRGDGLAQDDLSDTTDLQLEAGDTGSGADGLQSGDDGADTTQLEAGDTGSGADSLQSGDGGAGEDPGVRAGEDTE